MLAESGKEIILRVPIIPGVTDRMENMKAIARFGRELRTIEKIDLLPYHAMSVEKYRRMKIDSHFEPENNAGLKPLETLISLFTDEGFRVTTGG